ncbi:HDOD domain-containing protein, partial [bacterium]|nr:HDOD domain-containing protein [bacterium]
MSAASKGPLQAGVEAIAPQFDTCCPHCNTQFRLGRDAPLMKVDTQTLLAEREAEQMRKKDDEFQAFVVNKLLDKDFQIPLLPHVAVKVMRLTSDHHSSMQDMARVIMTDQGIAAKILQIANSPVYAGTEQIKTVSQALVRIGQTEIRNVMLSIALQGKVFKSKSYADLAKCLWEHSVAVAFASRVVANALRMPKEEAFLSGLMHE